MQTPSVPVDRLLALSKASDEMMRSVYRRDRHATLRTVARCVHDLLNAESCGIFLVPEDALQELALAAHHSDIVSDEDLPVTRLQMHSIPKGGMTGHIANQGEIVRLHGAQITESPYYAGHIHEYLSSKKVQSLLAIPLKDHKNFVLGLVKVENKKRSNGKADAAFGFDEADESIARILANKIVIVLENLRTSAINQGLVRGIHTAHDRESMLDEILQRSLVLVRADRGDLLTWSETQRDLIVGAQYGETTLSLGQSLPNPSTARRLWNDKAQTQIRIADVTQEADYHAVDARTRSQVAVKLQFEGRDIGILSAESFQLDGFDDQDLEMLQWLSQYAAIAYQVVGKETQFQGIVQRLVEKSPRRDEILNSILDSVRSIYGFTDGIIYIADYTDQMLYCLSYIGCEGLVDDLSVLSYHFDETALVTKVFRDRQGYFCANPDTDPYVSQRAMDVLKITGSVITIPLLFEEKVVGVFAVWSQNQLVTLMTNHLDELEPFARLAAANIALSETERQRSTVLGVIQDILTQMQTEQARDNILRLILHGVQTAGFDRVRIFEVDDMQQHIVGIDAVGMDHPEAFLGYTIAMDENPYVAHVAKRSLTDPGACWFDPKDESFWGPDPNAVALGKASDLPWLDVPLVIAGKFYGMIGADNARTCHKITSDQLEFMAVIGALAAQVIANAQTVDLLRDRTRAEARSELAQRTLHALKTPSMATQIFLKHLSQAMQADPTDMEQMMAMMDKIRGQLDRISAIAEGMQRLTTTTVTPKQRVNINKVVRRAILDSLTTETCEADFHFVKPSPAVEIDVDEIDQAITELAGNAWKMMGYNGRLQVTTRLTSPAECLRLKGQPDTPFVLIDIQDSGPGVPEPMLKELFKPGVSTTGGSGLGLYAIRTITTEHQGAVWLEETGPRGATFTMALPVWID
jgi:signal transduction histidine kinase